MFTNKTTHLRIRADRINTILTATNDGLGPIEDQLQVVAKWANSASRTILHSTAKPIQHPGLRLNLTANGNLPVANILRAYVVQIPGSEVFAIAAPNALISEGQQAFFDYVDKQKMERAWAAYSATVNGVPRVFVITAPVLPHILRDIPQSLTFATDEWAKWFHAWLGRFMLKHRYFNADAFNIASPIVEQVATVQEVAPLTQEPAQEAQPQPVEAQVASQFSPAPKHKGGRKKK